MRAPAQRSTISPRGALAVGLALLALASGCGGTPDELPEDPERALELLRECPPGDRLWRQAIGRATSADALRELGDTARLIGESCTARWEPPWTEGETLLRRSELTEARAPYERALTRARALDDPAGIACAINRLGTIDYFTGALESARERHDEAVVAARRAARADLTAFALNNLAGDLRKLGQIPRAIVAFDEAVALLDGQKLEAPARQAAYNQGVLALELGNVAHAATIFERVHAGSIAAGDTRTASLAALALGNLHLTLESTVDARRWLELATHDSPQVGVTREMGLGRADLIDLRLDDAAQRLDRSITLADEHELTIDALLARAWRANVRWRAGDPQGALVDLARVATAANEAGARQKAAWFASWTMGRIRLERGDARAALEDLRRAVQILEAQGERLDPLGAGLHFLLGRIDPYADLALALVGGGAPSSATVEELFGVIELAHARSLRDVGGARARTPVSVASIRESLQPGEVMLDYLLGREQGVVLAIGADATQVSTTPGWSSLAQPLARYRAALIRPLHDFAARAAGLEDLRGEIDSGRMLYAALLTPLESVLRDVKRIYVVPDRDLALLPFSALPLLADGPGGRLQLLGDRVEVAVLPMAGARAGTSAINGPIVLAGGPRPDDQGTFPALPRSRQELDSLAALWDANGTRVLRGERFTPEGFRDAVRGADVVHLATHAVASTLDPSQCAVIFDRGRRLGFDRIVELPLDGSLVVLSACRSGEGETIPGQGVVGLGWAFLAAGARGLTVSLWSVEDGAAAELMTGFHRRLQAGDDPVRALSTAQAALREQLPHPAFWAPFVIYLAPE